MGQPEQLEGEHSPTCFLMEEAVEQLELVRTEEVELSTLEASFGCTNHEVVAW